MVSMVYFLAHMKADVPEKIAEAVIQEMDRESIPGLSIAVMADNKICFSRGFGFADTENSVEAVPMTLFRTASIAKPITAAAVMHLAEKGMLDLDTPVQEYVPRFPEKKWPVTSRQLLRHTAGIRHYNNDNERLNTEYFDSLTDALVFFKDDPLLFEPDTDYSYSSFGYNLLGCTAEGAGGKPFVSLIQEVVFDPAEMKYSRADNSADPVPFEAQFYKKTEDGTVIKAPFISNSHRIPGGGMLSTAEDLVRFACAVSNKTIVSQKTLMEMWTPQKMRTGRLPGTVRGDIFMAHALGWLVFRDKNDRQVIRYGGTQAGTRALLYMLPEIKWAVTIMCNLEAADVDTLAARIVKECLD